ncbi:MAG: transketolase [Patescibacteria group bacterium]|nr:transketolase [Patescibacteria group bacterium]
MLYENSKLNNNTFDIEKLKQVPTRDGFGHGLVEAGEADEKVLALCADLAESTRAHWFKEKFPERYVELGVAEQNLATVASGMANYGKIPFVMSYATFSPGRSNEQVRTTIAINNVPVKIVGCHAGLSVGPDGATHQALEDIALMRVLPNMQVIVPADGEEARKATLAIAKSGKPTYLRLGRDKSPEFTTSETPFEIGKADILFKSKNPQVVIVACGALVHNALLAAHELEKEGLGTAVVNMATIKPFDKRILPFIKEVGALVSAEEHQVSGGLGSLLSEEMAKFSPVPQEFIGVHDRFGQSGNTKELFAEYGLDVAHIKLAVKKVLKRKNGGK